MSGLFSVKARVTECIVRRVLCGVSSPSIRHLHNTKAKKKTLNLHFIVDQPFEAYSYYVLIAASDLRVIKRGAIDNLSSLYIRPIRLL